MYVLFTLPTRRRLAFCTLLLLLIHSFEIYYKKRRQADLHFTRGQWKETSVDYRFPMAEGVNLSGTSNGLPAARRICLELSSPRLKLLVLEQ